MQPWCLCPPPTDMPLHWLSERSREWSSPVPSRPSPTRNTGRCMRNSRTWGWWPATSPSTPLPPASSWQQRWDVMLYEREDFRFIPGEQHGEFYLTLHADFSSRSWGACCTEAQKLCERWRGSSLMKSITWEMRVCTETTTDNSDGSFGAVDIDRIFLWNCFNEFKTLTRQEFCKNVHLLCWVWQIAPLLVNFRARCCVGGDHHSSSR